jgi:hypothetical protein
MERTHPGQERPPQQQQIGVAVITTSGIWPGDGYDTVPVHQKVRIQLERAARELRLTDTSNWLATAAGRELNVDASYLDNGLSGQVGIDFGPRAGGGGRE